MFLTKCSLPYSSLILVLLQFARNGCAQDASPCPRLFVYEPRKADEPDKWYGIITLLSESALTGVWLRVVFDGPTLQLGNWFGEVVPRDDENKDYLIKNRDFKLAANTPKTIRFFVKYDTNQPVPKLKEFRLNAKTICPEDDPSTQSPTTSPALQTSGTDRTTTSRPFNTHHTTTPPRPANRPPTFSWTQRPAIQSSSTDEEEVYPGDFNSGFSFFKPRPPANERLEDICGTVVTPELRRRRRKARSANPTEVYYYQYSPNTGWQIQQSGSLPELINGWLQSPGSNAMKIETDVYVERPQQHYVTKATATIPNRNQGTSPVRNKEETRLTPSRAHFNNSSASKVEPIALHGFDWGDTKVTPSWLKPTTKRVSVQNFNNNRVTITSHGFQIVQTTPSHPSRFKEKPNGTMMAHNDLTLVQGNSTHDTPGLSNQQGGGGSCTGCANGAYSPQNAGTLPPKAPPKPVENVSPLIPSTPPATIPPRKHPIQNPGVPSKPSESVLPQKPGTFSKLPEKTPTQHSGVPSKLPETAAPNPTATHGAAGGTQIAGNENNHNRLPAVQTTTAGPTVTTAAPVATTTVPPSRLVADIASGTLYVSEERKPGSAPSKTTKKPWQQKPQVAQTQPTTTPPPPPPQVVQNQPPPQQGGDELVQPRPLITYGQESQEAEFPWHAALYYTKGIDLAYICGASLISKNHVITVAHCVSKRGSSKPLNPDNLLIYLGKHYLKRWTSRGIQDKQITSVLIHPEYDVSTYRNDIAVAKFSDPAQFTDYVRPICLWTESTDLGTVLHKTGTVVGWGFDQTGHVTETLMKTGMPVVSQETCIFSYPDFFSRFTNGMTYCAGFRNGTSVCNGDSGGGMVFPAPGSNSQRPRWQLRGLVSISVAVQNQFKCDASHFVVFSDVAKYLNWIGEAMKL